ncbi:hypothetical protein IWW38_002457 [Coemansia aciculifera]|uniref:Uncharacterized protein n=1 Tax=Coemansia aciculifera TaxID=417176 RepID=A0ACC1M3F0_9FUNG|nr:hypothetical protein IWW38_002457 [Coemansia aciculifera]
MKLLSPALLLTSALVAAGAHAQNALHDRDILDDIQNGVQGALDGLASAIGFADTPANGKSTPATSTSTTTSAPTTPLLKPTSSSSTTSTTSSTSQKSTSSTQSPASDSGDNSGADSTSTTSSSSSPSPTPTGDACSGSGKRCPTVGENTYQQCLNNVWTNQKCGNALVCGLDSDGSVACMSKDQATMANDKCTGNAKRCHATDNTKYQQCNGSYWVTYTCANSATCSVDSNNNVICGSSSGGGGSNSVTYSLVQPQPYVPQSAAPVSAKLAVGVIAAALVAAALGMPALSF